MGAELSRVQKTKKLNRKSQSQSIYRHYGMRDLHVLRINIIKLEQMQQVNHQVHCLIAIRFKNSLSSIWQISWRTMNINSWFSLERSAWCLESGRRSNWLISYFWIIKLLRRLSSNVSKILRSGSPSKEKKSNKQSKDFKRNGIKQFKWLKRPKRMLTWRDKK